ncbi:MAG: TIM barrel protein [Canibacter sp.]
MTAKIASAPISWGVIEVPNWGVQLEPSRVLTEMSELGITATEFGPEGFLPADAEGRVRVLSEYGMQAVGGFFPSVMFRADEDPLPAIEKELEAYVAAGATVLVLSADTGQEGYDDRPELTEAEWDTLLTNLDRAVDAAANVGVTAVLHQHMGTVVQTPEETERVLNGSKIGLCLDTGHYALGGGDSLALLEKYADRVAHVHMKDVSFEIADRVKAGEIDYREGVRQGMYQALGAGDARVREVVQALKGANYSGWYVLEQDYVVENDADADRALDDARRSVAFIKEETA